MNQRWLTTLIVFLLGAFVVVYVVTNPGSLLGIFLIGIVAGLVLINRPQFLLTAALASGDMGLMIPLFGGVELQLVLFAALIVYGVMAGSIRKQPYALPTSLRFLMGFGLVLLVIILVRGIGFRIFGSEAFGGKDYLRVLFAIGAAWAALKVPITSRQAVKLVVVYALAPVIPFLGQVLVVAFPHLTVFIGSVVELRLEYLWGDFNSGTTIRRFQAASHLANGLWLLAWAALGFKCSSGRPWLYGILPALLALSALSGFRGSFVVLAVAAAWMLFSTARHKIAWASLGIATAVGGYLLLMVVGPSLPLNFQRTLSFLPGIDWDPGALSSALHSLRWRWELWRYAAKFIEEYLWIGRGLLLEDVFTVHAWRPLWYYRTVEYYYAAHGYHNGPLALLLDTGVAGLLTCLAFQINLVREAWHSFSWSVKENEDTFIRGALYFLAIWLTVNFFVFYLVFGDIPFSIPRWTIHGILVHTLTRANRSMVIARTKIPGSSLSCVWG